MASVFSRQHDIFIEGVGSFLLVAVVTSALTAINLSGEATSAAVLLVAILSSALTFGLLSRIFPRSNGFFNPAITVAAALDGHVSWKKLPFMLVIQLAGAVLASMVVALLYGSRSMDVNLGAVYPVTEMGPMAAMVAEAIGTAVVTAAALFVARRMAGERTSDDAFLLGIGLAIGMLMSMGVSGGALNPARALAPQLVAANLQDWWVYVAGPLVGAVLAAGLARWFNDIPAEQHLAKAVHEDVQVPSQPELRQPPAPAPAPAMAQPDEQDEEAVVIHRDASLEEKAAEALAKLRQQAEVSGPANLPAAPEAAAPGYDQQAVQFVPYNSPATPTDERQS